MLTQKKETVRLQRNHYNGKVLVNLTPKTIYQLILKRHVL